MNKATELQEGHKWVVGYEGLYSASAEGFIYGYKYGKYLKVHEKMIPYSLMAINGIIDNELWSKIYKSLRESFGN